MLRGRKQKTNEHIEATWLPHFQNIYNKKQKEIILNNLATEPLLISQDIVTNTKQTLQNRKHDHL